MTADPFLVGMARSAENKEGGGSHRVSGAMPSAVNFTAEVRSPKALTAFQQFEAFLLQNVIQSVLPRNAESVYGHGFTGESWKSILAEKLAMEIARNGNLGIASRLEASANQRSGEWADARGQITELPIADTIHEHD